MMITKSKGISRFTAMLIVLAMTTVAIIGNAVFSFADTIQEIEGFQVESVNVDGVDGYAIIGLANGSTALSGETLTIPETLNEKPVISIGSTTTDKGAGSITNTYERLDNGAYRVINNNNVTKIIFDYQGNADAFTCYNGAALLHASLDDIVVNNNNLSSTVLNVIDNNKILEGWNGENVYKVFGTNGASLTIPLSADGKRVTLLDVTDNTFGTLDLTNVQTTTMNTFEGATIGTLKVTDTTCNAANPVDILYGANVSAFVTDNDSKYATDGVTLWERDTMRLIKVSNTADLSNIDFSRFSSFSPYAFNTSTEAKTYTTNVDAAQNVVFNFYTEVPFVLNGVTAYCYNYGAKRPTFVDGSEEYAKEIDANAFQKINALMYAGIPNDNLGFFKDTFGVSYEEALQNDYVKTHGDAAANAMSNLVYGILGDGSYTNPSIGGTIFTQDKMDSYIGKLQGVINEASKYDFTPEFTSTTTPTLTQNGDRYVSEPMAIAVQNGDNEIVNDVKYTINIATEGVTAIVDGTTDEVTSFKTGDKVVFYSNDFVDTIEFTYDKPSLVYYPAQVDGTQNLLTVSSTPTTIEIKPTTTAAYEMDKHRVSLAPEFDEDNYGFFNEDEVTYEVRVRNTGALTITTKVSDAFEIPEYFSTPKFIKIEGDGVTTSTVLPAEVVTVTIKPGKEAVLTITSTIDKNTPEYLAPTTDDKKDNNADGYVNTARTYDAYYEINGKPHELPNLDDTANTPVQKPVEGAVTIYKYDLTGSKLSGAVLKLESANAKTDDKASPSDASPSNASDSNADEDEDGIIFDDTTASPSDAISITWNTKDENPKLFDSLPAGDYILTELEAPDGYLVADPIQFSYNGTDKKVIEMYDAKQNETDEKHLIFSKTDFATSEELPGAHCQIKDNNGNVIIDWTSTSKPYIFDNTDGTFKEGETYTYHEESAPNGYAYAEDIQFTITGEDMQKVVMTDKPTHVEFSKTDFATSAEISGAHCQIINPDGTVFDEWTSNGAPHVLIGQLIAGTTYKFHEAGAPAGYYYAEDIEFTVALDGSIQKIEMKDKAIGHSSSSSGGGSSTPSRSSSSSGGGSSTTTVNNTPTVTVTPNGPGSIPHLPKTSDYATCSIIGISSLIMLFLITRKKKYLF